MAALCNRAGNYIFALWFLSSSFFLLSSFSSPNLSGRRLDVYHTSTHGVALVPIQKTGYRNSPSGHHRTTLSGYIFATKAHIDNRENVLSSNISSTCHHNMVNFGPLAAEMVSLFEAPLQISTGFASWQRYCTALQYWASAKLCGVGQRAPPIFGRAAITFGIGPHFQFYTKMFVRLFRFALINLRHRGKSRSVLVLTPPLIDVMYLVAAASILRSIMQQCPEYSSLFHYVHSLSLHLLSTANSFYLLRVIRMLLVSEKSFQIWKSFNLRKTFLYVERVSTVCHHSYQLSDWLSYATSQQHLPDSRTILLCPRSVTLWFLLGLARR